MIDIHTHVFPPEIVRQRENYFGEDPAFRWLYDSPQAKLNTAEELIQAMADQGVEQSVIFGFPWRTLKLMRRHNDYIIEAQHRFPRHLIGFACVNALETGAAAEVERCLAAGCRGVGELAFYHEGLGGDILSALAPIADLCMGYGVPLLLHANEPVGHAYPGKSPMQLGDLYSLVKAFPELTLILAHWGGGLFFYNLLKKEVPAALKNVYFDTAASPFLYRPEIYRLAAEILGPEKILFGSDYPLLPPSRYLKEMQEGGLSPEHQEMILGKNALRLFGG
ncbi:MAG: amidohydrolase [Deltaproteobacteria bacterium]|nr:amidohydrolase [Deltaproteobacteria bacterium]